MDQAAAPIFGDRSFIPPEVYDAFVAVVERLEVTLERETIALAAQRHQEIAIYTQQKHQGFLELNRIMKSIERSIPSQDIMARLVAFRKRLEANDAMLHQQMHALKEVSDIIVKVLRDHESDGTYTRSPGYGEWEVA